MEARELMIDDLVIAYKVSNSNNLRKPRITKVTDIYEGGIFDGGNDFIEEEHIEPIPLTTEIMEESRISKSCQGRMASMNSSKHFAFVD